LDDIAVTTTTTFSYTDPRPWCLGRHRRHYYHYLQLHRPAAVVSWTTSPSLLPLPSTTQTRGRGALDDIAVTTTTTFSYTDPRPWCLGRHRRHYYHYLQFFLVSTSFFPDILQAELHLKTEPLRKTATGLHCPTNSIHELKGMIQYDESHGMNHLINAWIASQGLSKTWLSWGNLLTRVYLINGCQDAYITNWLCHLQFVRYYHITHHSIMYSHRRSMLLCVCKLFSHGSQNFCREMA